jgi:glycosyltransferase involved in cell wall biosynthesis
MNVLHVIPSIGPLRGGPSVAAVAMCRALADEGVACDLACTDDNGPGTLDVPVGEWTVYAGVRTIFFRRKFPSWPPVREFQIGAGFGAWLRAHARGYDVIHVHALFSHMPSTAMSFARRSGIPYVLRPLGILEEYSLRRSAWKKRAFLALFDAANIRGASAIHLTSRREDAVSVIPGPAQRWIIPLGVESPDATAACAGSPPQIVFLSRWHEKKRIETLIDALALLVGIEWKLVLAGDGDPALAGRIRALVSARGLGDRVSFPGFVAGDAKWKLLESSDLFVLPSASENFGIAAAEALACGIPCVVTRHVALADEIGSADAGWISGDPADDLAETLRVALADRAERARRGKNAARLARDSFSWKSCAERLASGYRELVSAPPAR